MTDIKTKIWNLAKYLKLKDRIDLEVRFPKDYDPHKLGYRIYNVTWYKGDEKVQAKSGFYDHHKSLYVVTKTTEEDLTQDILEQILQQLTGSVYEKVLEDDKRRLREEQRRRVNSKVEKIAEGY